VEAQACGTPVIAFGKGGALESVVDNKTGVFFYEQTATAIKNAVLAFEGKKESFDNHLIVEHAQSFSTRVFKNSFLNCIENNLKKNKTL
jgi:glycosyltransferase involved in cell wall biosynthesis